MATASTGVDLDSPGCFARSTSNGKWDWADHLAVIDAALVRAATIPDSRLIIQMPPRHGKSVLSSINFPSWYRLRFPRSNVMLWSATSRLAQRFSTHVRETVKNFVRLDDTTHSWEHWKVADSSPNEGEFYAAGVGGAATMGAGFSLGIVDDFFRDVEDALSENLRKKLQEWFLTSCITRAEPGASMVIICTRWHRDDLIGFIHREAEQSDEKWETLSMPAISDDGKALWPERWPIEKLQRIQRRYEISGYPWMWEALYQQRPPEILDSEWNPAYFGDHIWFDDWPETQQFRLVQLDPSIAAQEKSDYQAFIKLAVDPEGLLYVDAVLERMDAYAQIHRAIEICRDFEAHAFGVETNAFQKILEPIFIEVAKQTGFSIPMWGSPSTEEKITKIRAEITPFLAQNQIRFKRHSPGVNLLLEQMRGFPAHKYKDGPDALAMAIQLARVIFEYGPSGITDDVPGLAIAS